MTGLAEQLGELLATGVVALFLVIGSGFRTSWASAWTNAERRMDTTGKWVVIAGLTLTVALVAYASVEGISNGR